MSEKHEKLSREEIARREIGHTDISRRTAWIFTIFFLAFIFVYPLIQTIWELSQQRTLSLFQFMPLAGQAFTKPSEADSPVGDVRFRFQALNKAIKAYENQLDESSLLREKLLPTAQELMFKYLGSGNEKVVKGADGWLFYASDFDSINHPGFLQKERMTKRRIQHGVQPDPASAIIEFRDQLKERNIELIVMPVPIKVSLYADKLNRVIRPGGLLRNVSYEALYKRLEEAGIRVFDPAPILLEMRKQGKDPYLKTDTHWTPEAMERVAAGLAGYLDRLAPPRKDGYEVKATAHDVTAWGDIAEMFKLNDLEANIPKETVTVHEVDKPFDRNSDILVMGDSFFNIYSLPGMKWGGRAGFAEQLGRFGKRPIDALLRNDSGSYATRELLANELRRGQDRLSGKRVVVWEFAERELASGDWKKVDMTRGKAPVQTFMTLKPGEKRVVKATLLGISELPKPNSAPYKDHVATLHLGDIDGKTGVQALCYAESMRDNVLLPAAKQHVGATVQVTLRPWSEVESRFGSLKRSEFDDEELMLQEPLWGEFLP